MSSTNTDGDRILRYCPVDFWSEYVTECSYLDSIWCTKPPTDKICEGLRNRLRQLTVVLVTFENIRQPLPNLPKLLYLCIQNQIGCDWPESALLTPENHPSLEVLEVEGEYNNNVFLAGVFKSLETVRLKKLQLQPDFFNLVPYVRQLTLDRCDLLNRRGFVGDVKLEKLEMMNIMYTSSGPRFRHISGRDGALISRVLAPQHKGLAIEILRR